MPSTAAGHASAIDASAGVRTAAPSDAAKGDDPLSLVAAALKAMEERRTAQELAAAVDGQLVAGPNAAAWQVTFDGRDISASVATLPDGRIDQVVFSFRLADRLVLSDLNPLLGAPRKIAESKTSSVRFDRPAPGIVGYATLFSSKVLPSAPIIRVDLRLQN